MEVFISNLDAQAATDKIEEWLVPILNEVGIYAYLLSRTRNKSCARLTVADAIKAQALLKKTDNMTTLLPRCPRSNKPASLRASKFTPDSMLVKVLQKEEKEIRSPNALPEFGSRQNSSTKESEKKIQPLEVKSIGCGRWEIQHGQRLFVPYFDVNTKGSVARSDRTLIMTGDGTPERSQFSVSFDCNNIQSIVVPNSTMADTLLITLSLAPRIQQGPAAGLAEVLREILRSISDRDVEQEIRCGALPGADDLVAGSCLVYQIILRSMVKTSVLRNFLKPLSGGSFRIWSEDIRRPKEPVQSFLTQVAELDEALVLHRFPFSVRFQLHALWRNATFSPGEVRCLLQTPAFMQKKSLDQHDLVATLRFVHSQLPFIGPGSPVTDSGTDRACQILSQSTEVINPGHDIIGTDEVMVHRVLVTPTGTYLYGPDKETTNRVIRQYIRYSDHFVRVTFADESGDKIMFNSDVSNERILRGRFLDVLQQGLDIAGEHFDFLGFSHSSLRSQTCWFMRSFVYRGGVTTAKSVIASLGDFSHIMNPAKCAARIGQAFSDTQRVVSIDTDDVYTMDDIKLGRFLFTDGCGTISRPLWQQLINKYSNSVPTLFQIRYAGAKGMLSLDTRLLGRQMRLRPSMIKFEGSPSNDIEICGANAHPLPFKLNRQLVKILEDLDITYEVFEIAQERAVENLRRSARSTRSAIDFFCSNMADNSIGIAPLVRRLADEGIDAIEDQFIRVVIRRLIEVQLRELKFRTRIPVKQAVTLYGICDETEFLEEGQVYVTFETQDGRHTFLKGDVLVTRSPALHPGDVQVATAVAAPEESPLTALTNCIVFSSKGARDLPSMLAGGDLDGDIFGVIYDTDLIPSRIASPAEYPPAPSVNLERSVTSEDMTKFFIDFMENDQLGRIATLHQVYADQAETGTLDPLCLKLAELHSVAVDFSKSGQPVNTKAIPKTPPCRPDFMASSTSAKVYRGIKDAEKAAETDSKDNQRYRYYESDRVLGKLYRSINEDEFFEDLQDDDVSIFSREGSDDVMSRIWELVQGSNPDVDWESYLDAAQQAKDSYESMLWDIMTAFAPGHGQAQQLTEHEVLVGTIIGGSGTTSNRHQREQSETMKLRYKYGVRDIRQWMKAYPAKHGADDDHDDVYLALSIACLSLCVAPVESQPSLPSYYHDDEGYSDTPPPPLRSFGWFAAGICVPKLLDRTY